MFKLYTYCNKSVKFVPLTITNYIKFVLFIGFIFSSLSFTASFKFNNFIEKIPVIIRIENEIFTEENLTKEIFEKSLKQKQEKIDNEINQLKQELERVEKEGFGALKPIYNFYENTVTNILKKTYGKENVKQITDEYGNTWNEITIDNSSSNNILLKNNFVPASKANPHTVSGCLILIIPPNASSS